ncbi:DNA replication/repair protein RecF [Gryllotalpicola protaetiae]|uniref:DNA replication and repair protein RecF n=1 Tax=Gryllotalpicola protaetiae TaxID=2419771 RepID=A0A387BR65_9MICO|nr:DNA replication/repair protein RecF [Gryllotalpicola protaetiae]AYG03549.1 DNA replication/repair protein RecF [Gryllotalpicola protaetiae]
MHVKHLSLADFRNYREAELDLEPGVTVFVGPNGQGKTNLVESLGYLATLGSHRTSVDSAMIRAGTDAAVIRALLRHIDRELLVEVQLNRGAANRAQVNRAAVRTRELPRYFSSVLFAPEDLALVRGEPSTRRRFIDELLVQRSPRLAGVQADYARIVTQRNSLLKSARAQRMKESQLSTLDIWDERLVELGSELIDRREALVGELAEPLRAAYQAVAGVDQQPRVLQRLSIYGAASDDDDGDASSGSFRDGGSGASSTIGRIETADAFRAALAGVRRKELERGLTLVGPHRDDLLFELNELPAKGYASHGESWSFALGLRLASAQLLRVESVIGDPVLVLDDVFAELDSARRRALASAVRDFEQVLITAAVLEDVPDVLEAAIVKIKAGEVVADE